MIEQDSQLNASGVGADQRQSARLFDHRRDIFDPNFHVAAGQEIAKSADDLSGAQRLLQRLAHDLAGKSDRARPSARQQALGRAEGICDRGHRLIQLMRERRGHLAGGAQPRCVVEFEMRLSQSRVQPLVLLHSGDQLPIRVREFARPLSDFALSRDSQLEKEKVELEFFLCTQVPADSRNIEGTPLARVVYAEPIDQERNILAAREMTKPEFADPAPRLHDGRPSLITRSRLVHRREEFQHVFRANFLKRFKSDEVHPRPD